MNMPIISITQLLPWIRCALSLVNLFYNWNNYNSCLTKHILVELLFVLTVLSLTDSTFHALIYAIFYTCKFHPMRNECNKIIVHVSSRILWNTRCSYGGSLQYLLKDIETRTVVVVGSSGYCGEVTILQGAFGD